MVGVEIFIKKGWLCARAAPDVSAKAMASVPGRNSRPAVRGTLHIA